MDAMMKGLFGGDDDRNQSRDFIQRYETGDPTEGYSSEEAYQQYGRVSQHLSPEDYQDAAEQAFNRMRPDQRSQFAQMLGQQMGGSGFQGYQQTDDPRQLAQAVAQYRQQDQGGLGSLFGGGGGGGGLGGMLGGLLGGDDDRNRSFGGRSGGGGGLGGMMDNPLAKAALGGIAAMAMKKMIDRR